MINKIINKIYREINEKLNLIKSNEILKFYDVNKIEFLNSQKTLDLLISSNISFARFGDGEFSCLSNMMNYNSNQNCCFRYIKKHLRRILHEKSKYLLIGIIPPPSYSRIGKIYKKSLSWNEYFYVKTHKYISKSINFDNYYADATVFLQESLCNLSVNDSINYYYKCKQIWANKKVVFIYSFESDFNIKSKLFDNCQIIKKIDIPLKCAMNNYNSILNSCLSLSEVDVFLVAGGFLGTILTSDLSKNHRAIDIGHISERISSKTEMSL